MNDIDVEFPSARVRPSKTLGHYLDQAAFERFADVYRRAAATLPPAEARTIETSYGLVRCYRFTADGVTEPGRTPIVLLSGRNAATPMWAPALPALLALGRPIHAFDSIGEAGCSAQTAPLETIEHQTAWVAEALQGLELGRVHLVGHSLGGWLAAHVAMRRPELLASVTALDPPRVFTELSAGFVAAGLTASASVVPDAWRRRLLGWIAGGPITDSDPLGQLGWVGLKTFAVHQQPPQLPGADDLAGITTPLLAVLAGRSRVHDAEAAARGARRVPGARVELWPDAGHALHAEEPARLAELLGDFIASTDL